MTTPIITRYSHTLVHIRPFGPGKITAGLYGVPNGTASEVVEEALATERAAKNVTVHGLPNIGTIAPLLFVVTFTADPDHDGVLVLEQAEGFSPNGESIFSVSREFVLGLASDAEAEAAFSKMQERTVNEAFGDEEAWPHLSVAYAETMKRILKVAQTLSVFLECGRLALDENGEYVLNEQGSPMVVSAVTDDEDAGRKYEADEIADANEREIPGDRDR